jgi:hypothetical protein
MRRIRQFQTVIPKLRALSASDWLRLGRAQLALLAAQLDVWLRPQGTLVASANRGGGDAATAAEPPAAPRPADAERIGTAVRRVATHGIFRPTCLVRSIAICRLLRREHIDGGRIRVGVALRDGRFVAHAWVEYAGVVVGDEDALVRRYEAFDDLEVVTGR